MGQKVILEFALLEQLERRAGEVIDEYCRTSEATWLIQTNDAVEVQGVAWRYFLVPSPDPGLQHGSRVAGPVRCVPSSAVIDGSVGQVPATDRYQTAQAVLTLDLSPSLTEVIDRRAAFILRWIGRWIGRA